MSPITPKLPRRSRSVWKPIALATIGVATLVSSGVGVFATLQAQVSNVTPQAVDSGTLTLALSNNGVGFSQAISNLAPGDTVNRFVTLKNTGTLDGQTLTLQTASTGSQNLITDGSAPSTTKALRISVTSCSVAWTPATGVCGGTSTEVLSSTALSAAATTQTLLASAVNSNDEIYLRMRVVLPDQNETTVNGVTPTNTVQGGNVNLTYTFGIAQRNATTTNS